VWPTSTLKASASRRGLFAYADIGTTEGRGTVTKREFLTRRWNNWLTLGMGLPILTYAAVGLFTSVLSDLAGFAGMAFLGAAY
jgi:hypothetical protein